MSQYNTCHLERNQPVSREMPMAKILIVDDQRIQRVLLRALLEYDGHEIHEAGDGQEALDHYQSDPTDLVITDTVMPVISGLELCERLIQHNPEVKIIAISGGTAKVPGAANEYLKLAWKTDVVRTMTKPVAPEDLQQAVKDVLAN